MAATTCTAITWAAATITAEPPNRRAEQGNRGRRIPQDHGGATRDDLNVNDRPEQSIWLGAGTVGQRRCVVVGAGALWSAPRHPQRPQPGPCSPRWPPAVYRASGWSGQIVLPNRVSGWSWNTPMPPLMAPARTKDGAEGAHLQPDALTHGESCFLCWCSRVPRCPTDAGPNFVPLMSDRAEQYEAAGPFAITDAASHKKAAQDQTGPMAQGAARRPVRSGQGNSRRCQVQPGKRQRLGEIYLTLLFGHPPGAHLDHDRPREPLYRKGFE
jgi:hypothetical protein